MASPMNRRQLLRLAGAGALGAGATALLAACSSPASAPAATAQPVAPTTAAASSTSVNLYVGGDVNIRDMWQKQLLPAYAKVQPNVNFQLVFDEHALSDQSVMDKLAGAKQAGAPSGIDLWESARIAQAGAAGLMQKVTTSEIANLANVPQNSYDAFGGYGVPYRASSVILAYNSADVPTPPATLDDLLTWIKSNDGKFTYNPPDKGGSGGNFVERVLSLGIPQDQLTFFYTQYDEGNRAGAVRPLRQRSRSAAGALALPDPDVRAGRDCLLCGDHVLRRSRRARLRPAPGRPAIRLARL